jgi:cellulose synthase operon protein C
MASSNVITMPRGDTDFEEKCVPLFAGHVGDPNFKRVATSGKNQGGIDLIGARDRDPHQPVGVQCKLKTKGDKLAEKEVRSDVSRALGIKPPLTEIYVVTTASDDLAYDALALTLRQEQLALGRRVDVQIWGWDELQRRIRLNQAALDAFDPDYSASTSALRALGQANLETGREAVTAIGDVGNQTSQLVARVAEMHAILINGDSDSRLGIDTALNAQVDQIRDLLNSGKARTALDLLVKLEATLDESSSAAIRARVTANIGFAHLKTGNDDEAARRFIAAYDLDPQNPKMRANRLLGLAIAGEIDAACDGARGLLQEDPTNDTAATVAYQAWVLGAAADPDTFVSDDLQSKASVAVARVCAFATRRPEAWCDVARSAHAAHPGDEVIARFYGEALLAEALEPERVPYLDITPEGRRTRIEQAIELIRRYWDVVRFYEGASDRNWLGVGLNLLTAYRALHDRDNAELVAGQVLAAVPNDPDARIAAAHIDILSDREEAALAKIKNLPDSPSRTVAMLLALGSKQDWEGIIAFLTPQREQAVKGLDGQLVDTMRLRARFQTGLVADAEAELDAVVARWPGSVAIMVTAAEAASHHAPGLSRGHLDAAIAALTPTTPFGDRMMLAEYAMSENDYDTVIIALDGQVRTDEDSPGLRWLALAFANAATRPRTHAFFTALSPELLAEARYARLAGAAEHARGDLRAAERHLRTALAADPKDLRVLMILHSALVRANRKSEAGEVVRAFDEGAAEGLTAERMRLAVLLRHHGEPLRALTLGYDIASQHRDERKVVEAYPALVFLDDALPPELNPGGMVSLDCWFDLEGIGDKDVSGIIQEGQTPEVTSYLPDHPLSKALLGKAIGDEITLPQGLGPDRRYRVRDIKHRYIWLLHDISRSHATRFPESASFAEMTVEDHDISPILDMARHLASDGDGLADTYARLGLPLEILADLRHKSVIALAEIIPQHGGEISTCIGTREEREDAERQIAVSKGKGAVLDTFTAWYAHNLGLLPSLQAFFGSLVIAQSAIDELIELREKETPNLGREYMTLGFEGEQPVRRIHPPEETAARVNYINGAIAALQHHCSILPVDGTDDHELRQLAHEATIRAMLDPILLAVQHDYFLLSDDFHLRQIASQKGCRRTAWLQIAARHFREKGFLPGAEYAKATAMLAALKHGHVSLDGRVLFELATMDDPNADAYFQAAIGYLGGPRADMISHAAAAADFMASIWSSGLPSWRKGRFCGLLIDRLVRHDENWTRTLDLLAQVIRTLRGNVLYRHDLAIGYLQEWRVGHFLMPAAKNSTRKLGRTTNGNRERVQRSRISDASMARHGSR